MKSPKGDFYFFIIDFYTEKAKITVKKFPEAMEIKIIV